MSNPTMIQFADKCVPYEVFVKDLAREIYHRTKPLNYSVKVMSVVG